MNKFVLIALRNYLIQSVQEQDADSRMRVLSMSGFDKAVDMLDDLAPQHADNYQEAVNWFTQGLVCIRGMGVLNDMRVISKVRVEGPCSCIRCHQPYSLEHICNESYIFEV